MHECVPACIDMTMCTCMGVSSMHRNDLVHMHWRVPAHIEPQVSVGVVLCEGRTGGLKTGL